MKNRIMLFVALLFMAAGIGVIVVAWPETVKVVLNDSYTWFRYFLAPSGGDNALHPTRINRA